MPNWLHHLKSLRTQYIKLPGSKPLSSTGHFVLSSYDRMSKLSFPLPASAGIWYTTFSYPGEKNIRQWWWKAASQTAAGTGGCYSWIASAICRSPAPYISLFHFINTNILVSSQQLYFLSHMLLVDLKAMGMEPNRFSLRHYKVLVDSEHFATEEKRSSFKLILALQENSRELYKWKRNEGRKYQDCCH